MIGRTVGDYQILEKRGEGGMGMFFRALDTRLDRLVGLKTLRPELLDDPEILARLNSEAKSLARLDHPNIARLLHYLVVENQHYIVMEFVEGDTLGERLRRTGPLPIDLLADITRQVCAAIGYAHSKDVIHRDIKPSNILLTPEGTVKVTDFGIAKILGVSTKTRTGAAPGSLPYMAPEQVQGREVDQRTDIYQLGVTLFELATGKRPFVADSEFEMMRLHLEAPPPRPSSLNSNIPLELDAVILKAMAKAPGERFQGAREFANALPAVGGPYEDAKTVLPVHRARNQKPAIMKHRRGPYAVIAVLVALVAVFVVLLTMKRRVPSDNPETSSPRDTAVGLSVNREIVEELAPNKPDVETPDTGVTRPASPNPTPNLAIDVQPFSLRTQVSGLSIDDREMDAGLPVETQLSGGRHQIRWRIGHDRFSDQVTIASGQKTEYILPVDPGRGRLNVAATFPDGGTGEIWIDGVHREAGTPNEFRDIAAGPHEVVVKQPGYKMVGGPQIVRVKANGRVEAYFEMTPQ